MAKDTSTPASTAQAAPAATKEAQASIPFKKLVMIGVPVFLVQLVLIYFLIAKFLAPNADTAGAATTAEPAHSEEVKEPGEASPEQIFVIKDVIINPAGTNGTRFLLTTIGIEVSNPEARAEIEKKELQMRDALNTILTSKGLAELGSVERREMLRAEIAQKLGEMIKSGKMKNVYFSKFIIQ